MVTEMLIAEAVKAATGALTREAVGPALAAGQRVWAWLRARLAGRGAEAVAAVEADATKGSARLKLSAALAELLEEEPDLATALENELRESGYREAAIMQTADTEGDHNTTAQAAGQGNTISIGRG